MAATLRPIFNLSKYVQPVFFIGMRRNYSAGDSNILKSPMSDVVIPRVSLPELIITQTAKWENRIAAMSPTTGKSFTYSQLRIYSQNLAGVLRKKMKFNKGDVVAILMPNSPEYAVATLGILRAGLVATTVNPIYTPAEISRQLTDSGAKAIITITDLWQTAKAAANLTDQPLNIFTVNNSRDQSTPSGAISFSETIQDNVDISDIPYPDPENIAFLPYSSGTTGLPKGVELPHYQVVANLFQMKAPEIDYLLETTNDHQDIIPAVLPQFHIYGLTLILYMSLLKGAKLICLPKFEPKTFIEMIAHHRSHIFFVAPPLVLFMTSQSAVKPEYLESARHVISGAAPLGPSDIDRFKAKVNRDISFGQGYGMTEASPVIAVTFKDGSSTQGSTGPPLPNSEIKVVDVSDASSQTLGANQSGEVYVRGPQIMKGYHNRPKETSETVVDGWLRTGDIGFYDEHGCLTITDRLKELIKVKGFQVPPAELEEVIRQYPNIEDVGVIGVPHERYGEVPRAYISIKRGENVDANKLQEFVKTKVAEYKQLKGGVCIIEAIPKNASGKILRKSLCELYEKEKSDK